ncbi:UNVERIFIED_CONTAM: hypothetical protein PYX00_009602 [Menopon gallinae]|uniref:DUF155 domain-containing protein n=1 Tax=Menopon gallinae TaxID=328185 RepID=A0AAW2HBU3_9NEOP
MNLCLKICFGVSQRKCLTTCVKYVMPVMSDFLRFDNRRELHGLIRKYTTSDLTSTSQLRKKPFKKKSIILKDSEALRVSAFTTAEEFNIENLKNNLRNSMKYKLTEFNSEFGDTDSVVHIVPTDSGCLESKDVFLFREGSVVLWNLNEDEILHLLQFLKNFHKDSFSDEIVKNEQESMLYVKSSELSKTILTGGKIILAEGENEILDKFAVSNAMALSVHLGAYESLLSEYIDSMFFVTEDLKSGRTIKMNQKEVLRKMGHLFALRHVINLSSDLLDTPDFYFGVGRN